MTSLDIVILLIVGYMTVRGFLHGFVDTLFSLGAWVLAFYLGKWGAVVLAPVFGIEPAALAYFVGFAVVFIVVLIAVLLVGHLLSAALRAIGLGPFNTVLGGALGFTRSVVVLTGLTLAAGLTALPKTDFWRDAALTAPLQRLALLARHALPDDLAQHVQFVSPT
jgi:membrane protein required for colicin V production